MKILREKLPINKTKSYPYIQRKPRLAGLFSFWAGHEHTGVGGVIEV